MIRGYEKILEDSSSDARNRERLALSHGIALLQRVQEDNCGSQEAIEALLYIRRLWTFLIEDLARPGNGLPESLRADLISIGLWVIKEADAVRHRKSESVANLIAINTAIRDGLA